MKKSFILFLVLLLTIINSNVVMVEAASDFRVENGVLISYWSKSKVATIPSNVKILGYESFANNDSIEKVIIPKSVKEIDVRAFFNCKNLKTIVWEEGTKIVGAQAFYGCNKLSSIKPPKSITTWGKKVFDETAWMKKQKKKEFIIINNALLQYNGNKKDVKIPDTVEIIAGEAFAQNQKIVTVDTGANLKTIGVSAFYNCKNLSFIKLSERLKLIDESAFCYCSNLREIELPKSLNYIKEHAFWETSLNRIVIPKNVKEVGSDAFYDVSTLENVEFKSRNTRVASDAISPNFLYKNSETWHLSFLHKEGDYNMINSTIVKYYGKDTHVVIPEGITVIGAKAFSNNKKIKSISFPKSLRYIESDAFESCTNLTEVKFKEGLERVEEDAFYNSGIKKITFPKSLRVFTFKAFDSCKKLETVVFKEGITDLGEYFPWEEDHTIKDIYVPKSVKYLPRQETSGTRKVKTTLHCYKNYKLYTYAISINAYAKSDYKIKLRK